MATLPAFRIPSLLNESVTLGVPTLRDGKVKTSYYLFEAVLGTVINKHGFGSLSTRQFKFIDNICGTNNSRNDANRVIFDVWRNEADICYVRIVEVGWWGGITLQQMQFTCRHHRVNGDMREPETGNITLFMKLPHFVFGRHIQFPCCWPVGGAKKRSMHCGRFLRASHDKTHRQTPNQQKHTRNQQTQERAKKPPKLEEKEMRRVSALVSHPTQSNQRDLKSTGPESEATAFPKL